MPMTRRCSGVSPSADSARGLARSDKGGIALAAPVALAGVVPAVSTVGGRGIVLGMKALSKFVKIQPNATDSHCWRETVASRFLRVMLPA